MAKENLFQVVKLGDVYGKMLGSSLENRTDILVIKGMASERKTKRQKRSEHDTLEEYVKPVYEIIDGNNGSSLIKLITLFYFDV